IVGNWTVEGGLQKCEQEYGTKTCFAPTKLGEGTITATNGSYRDTTGLITVSLGALDHIRIEYPDGTEAVATQTTTDDTFTLCLRGYDADHNLIGDIAGTWTVKGGIGNCTPGYGTQTYFDSTTPGIGTITATDGVHTDSSEAVTVAHGKMVNLRIVPETSTLTADESKEYKAIATDSDGNLWDATKEVTWSEDDPVGTMSVNAYHAGQTGTWIITGTITNEIVATAIVGVTPGAFVNLNLTIPQTTTTFAAFTLTVSLYDSDGNPYSGTVAVTNTTNSILPGIINLVSGTCTGTGTITKSIEGGTDTITVTYKTVKATKEIKVFIDSQQGGVIVTDKGVSVEFDQGDLGTATITVHIGTSTQLSELLPGKLKGTGIAYNIALRDEFGNEVGTRTGQIGTVAIHLAYADVDNDGKVDGTQIKEENLIIYQWEGIAWKALPTLVDGAKNVAGAYVTHLSAFTLLELKIADLNDVIVYPSPFIFQKHESHGITFGNLTEQVTIKIFNISGELIAELNHTNQTDKEVWRIDSKDIASGIYIYLITNNNGQKAVGKIGIVD
ncbi:MAG: T9SS type A sorting domain-containing protein, partial [bacterium]